MTRSSPLLAILLLGAVGCGTLGPGELVPPQSQAGDNAPPLPTAVANDHRTPAGDLRGDTLHLTLVATMARWYPEAEDGSYIETAAFAADGEAPHVPGPLVRVSLGTVVHASVRNDLRDTLIVVGLTGPAGAGRDTLRLAPGDDVAVTAPATAVGTYSYYGHTLVRGEVQRHGPGEQLFGTFIVDGDAPSEDRILVIKAWNGPPAAGTEDPFVMVINGKSWPFTERLHVNMGDTLRLRVINGSDSEHPMHLHGFYYHVDALGTWHADRLLDESERFLAVTHTLRVGETMALTWVAERAGNWLFHCHNAVHIDGSLHQDLARQPRDPSAMHHHGPGHAERAMAGLVTGIIVAGEDPLPDATGARPYRLGVRAQPRFFADSTDAYFYTLEDSVGAAGPGKAEVEVPGSPLVLTRGEKAAITVVNHLPVPTSVHWHGQELASYYDGVPGWSGLGTRLAPMIAPADSFTAVLVPPRAGTFIYHTHFDDVHQLNAGLVGPLLVLEPGETYDPARDHIWLFHVAGQSDEAPVVLNGGETALELQAGVRHRIRIIVITAGDEMDLEFLRGDDAVTWRAVAKDGADLSDVQRRFVPARLHAGPGEIYDFEWTPEKGTYLLRVSSFNNFQVVVNVQ